MATDVLAPYVASPTAAMILNVGDKRDISQLHTYQCDLDIENW